MNVTHPKIVTSFYVVGGTVRRDAPCYVERQADTDLYEGLKQGQFCYVLTARQMGKSSLMVRTAARLRDEGVGVAVLDLTAIGQNLSAEQWYGGLLTQLGQQLDLEEELSHFRHEHPELGPLQRWMCVEKCRVVQLEHRKVDSGCNGLDRCRDLVARLIRLNLDTAGVKDHVRVREYTLAFNDHSAAGHCRRRGLFPRPE